MSKAFAIYMVSGIIGMFFGMWVAIKVRTRKKEKS